MLSKFIERKDRTRIEKLGSGLGNYTGLLIKFGYACTWLIGGRRSSRLFLSVAAFGKFLLSWKGQATSLVKYLKVSQIMLMQAVSLNPRVDGRKLGSVVGRGLGGLPRIIPPMDRQLILRGSIPHIRLWLSLLGGYRVIECRGKASFKSIVQPGVDITKALASFRDWLFRIEKVEPFASIHKLIPKENLRFSPLALLTSGPNVPPGCGSLWTLMWDSFVVWSNRETPWGEAVRNYTFLTGNHKFYTLLRKSFKAAHRYLVSSPHLHKSDIGSVVDRITKSSPFSKDLNILLSKTRRETEDGVEKSTNVLDFKNWVGALRLGRLHLIHEPAGKVRVVAMVTWWIQCLLYPLHSEIFRRLYTIRQDGTYDQKRPIELLAKEIRSRLKGVGKAYTYSFDLKAATDRIPIEIQMWILEPMLGRTQAKAWRVILSGIPYALTRLKTRFGLGGDQLWYSVGQPMGAYSSWAMLALTHHYLVQYAAYKTGYRGWYPYYAVLGDDIVILGKAVAAMYRNVCSDFGIEISIHKSLISSNGTFEFAKKFYYRGIDASALSAREYWVALGSLPAFVELVSRAKSMLPSLRLSDAIRAYGKGYRVVAKFTTPFASLGNTRVANLIAALCLPGGPFAKSLASLFSPTSTVVRPDENLVDSPITERRVKSVSRVLGQSILDTSRLYATSAEAAAKEGVSKGAPFLKSKSDRVRSGLFDISLPGSIAMQRAVAINNHKRELNALSSVGTYLHKGKLNLKRFITVIEKLIPIWTFSVSDVGSLPLPFALLPVSAVLKRPALGRLLKLRVRLLGLSWRKKATKRDQNVVSTRSSTTLG